MSEQIYNDLISFLEEKKVICPQPQQWNALWELLPDKKRKGLGWEPSLPLILAAWWDTPTLAKTIRFKEHIDYAYKMGCIAAVDQMLRSWKDDEWYYGNY